MPPSAAVADSKRAYIYQKWVCDLSPGIKIQMQLNTAAIEAKSAAKGINLRASDPVALVTQAATIVLSDEANEEMIKAINNGGQPSPHLQLALRPPRCPTC